MNLEEADKIVSQNGFAAYIGMKVTKVETGYAEGRICMKDHHTNPYGGMHGGCVYALADTVAGIAAATAGRAVTTLNGGMNYLRPVKDTEYVICKARAARLGKTIAVIDVVIENDSGDILSSGSFNFYQIGKPSSL